MRKTVSCRLPAACQLSETEVIESERMELGMGLGCRVLGFHAQRLGFTLSEDTTQAWLYSPIIPALGRQSRNLKTRVMSKNS